jgi:hypothetical protein
MIVKQIGEPFLEQAPRLKWDRTTGYTFEREWQGRIDLLGFGFTGFIQGAQQADFKAEGCKGTVVSRYGNADYTGATEVPTVSLTLRTEEITQSIFKHPNFSGIPIELVKLIQAEHGSTKLYSESKAAIKLLCDVLQQPYDPSLAAFDLLTGNQDSYEVAQTYALTMTRTASYSFALPLVFANDGKLFTTNQLANYIASPIPWAIPAFNSFATSEALRYVYGWRKRGSEVHILPNGNQQLQETWGSNRWTLLLYDPAS